MTAAATTSSYSETADKMRNQPRRRISLSPAGAAAGTGIREELSDFPSLSMTHPGPPLVLVYYLPQEGEREHSPEMKSSFLCLGLWQYLEAGSEWSEVYAPPGNRPILSPQEAEFPQEVRTHLVDLRQVLQSENDLYEIADAIAEWVANASETEQTALATYLRELPPKGTRIFLSALADAEVKLTSETLLYTIASFLGSEDKRLAQAAAVCLLQCGGSFGRALLQEKLKDPVILPHLQLIQGVMDLLAPQ